MTWTLKVIALAAISAAGAGLAGCGASHGRPPAAPLRLAAATADVAPGTVTSQGTGRVAGEPDTLTVGIGVSTTSPHAAGALEQNNRIAAAVQAALARDGVPAADIRTTGLSLQQNWAPNGPNGYTVYDEVTATLHHLSAAGTMIDDALTPAGDSGRLNEATLSFSDGDPLMAAARKQAVQSAETQAAQMAAASGGHLGELKSLTENAPQDSQYPMAQATAGAAASMAVPIQAGTEQVSVQVTGVWQVVPGT